MIELWTPTTSKMPFLTYHKEFKNFVQMQINRLVVGYFRHEQEDKKISAVDRKFVKRAKTALDSYVRTGNTENLINAANYCYLEFQRPSHKEAYFEAEDSYGKTKNYHHL
jgi:transcriptional regulator with AAA-type ATPase domain